MQLDCGLRLWGWGGGGGGEMQVLSFDIGLIVRFCFLGECLICLMEMYFASKLELCTGK